MHFEHMSIALTGWSTQVTTLTQINTKLIEHFVRLICQAASVHLKQPKLRYHLKSLHIDLSLK